MAFLLLLTILVNTIPQDAYPLLERQKAISDVIDDGDRIVETAALESIDPSGRTVGKRYTLDAAAPGTYTIEMRSFCCDTYLVLRNGAGDVVAEDDNGLYHSHSRLVFEADPGDGAYRLDACALGGDRGPFVLTLLEGEVPELAPPEKRAAFLNEVAEAERSSKEREEDNAPLAATVLGKYGNALRDLGRYAEAGPLLERALELRERSLGKDHPLTGASLHDLALLRGIRGKFDEAGRLLSRALEIIKNTRGPEHPDIATCYNSLAVLHWARGDCAGAKQYLQRAITLRQKALGAEHPDTVSSLNNMAGLLQAQGKPGEARALYERVLEIRQKVLGPSHPDVAATLNDLAGLYNSLDEHARAKPLLERALEIYILDLGAEHPLIAVGRHNLAAIHVALGDYAGAEGLYKSALAIRRNAFGPEHPDVAQSLANLAELYVILGDYNSALRLHERALEIRKKALGSEHPAVANSLSNLAGCLESLGDYAGAEDLFDRALEVLENDQGREHPNVGAVVNNLATLHDRLGHYARAESLYRRALEIARKRFGPEHTHVATALDNLATIYNTLGDHARAKPLYERALEIRQSALGMSHPKVAKSNNSLAEFYRIQGDFARAEPLFRRALKIRKKSLGMEHPDVAATLNNLGLVRQSLGDLAGARSFYEHALEIRQKALHPEHPDVAQSLNNLAAIHHSLGELDRAEPLYTRALEIRRKIQGAEHPHVAKNLNNLALLLADRAEAARAWALSQEAVATDEAHQHQLLWSLTEHERLRYAGQKNRTLEILLSLARGQPADDADQAAYEILLRWKGRVSESLLQSRDRLMQNRSAEVREVVDGLKRLKAALSNELYNTEIRDRKAREARLSRLREETRSLETRLHRLVGKDEGPRPARSVRSIRASLRPKEALVDFYVHRWYSPALCEDGMLVREGRWSVPHLSAWILDKNDETVRHLDLGPAAPIEEATRAHLAAIVDGDVEDADGDVEDADVLRALLWEPLAPHLGNAETIFVSPDSFLGTLPLETIRVAEGNYLIDDHAFVYLQNVADLVEPVIEAGANSAPSLLAVGAVDYEKRANLSWRDADSESAPRGDRPDGIVPNILAQGGRTRGDAAGWKPLPGTLCELEAIRGLHEVLFLDRADRLELKGAEATEERIKTELPAYQVAHIATHGFFKPRWLPSLWDEIKQNEERGQEMGRIDRNAAGLLPGYLSGLVFSGTNAPPAKLREDGLLTAEEISWMDLSGVRLAVLSACETGLGSPTSGEGMLGLGRALRQAGAGCVITSLWKVDDQAAGLFFTAFYRYLWVDGMNPAAALRRVKMDMMRGALVLEESGADRGTFLKPVKKPTDYRSPYFWGSFVVYGRGEG